MWHKLTKKLLGITYCTPIQEVDTLQCIFCSVSSSVYLLKCIFCRVYLQKKAWQLFALKPFFKLNIPNPGKLPGVQAYHTLFCFYPYSPLECAATLPLCVVNFGGSQCQCVCRRVQLRVLIAIIFRRWGEVVSHYSGCAINLQRNFSVYFCKYVSFSLFLMCTYDIYGI